MAKGKDTCPTGGANEIASSQEGSLGYITVFPERCHCYFCESHPHSLCFLDFIILLWIYYVPGIVLGKTNTTRHGSSQTKEPVLLVWELLDYML